MANLEGAIDSLHSRLTGQNARLTQEARLTAVLDGMIEGIWITDDQGTIVRHNDALREMLQPGGTGIVGQRPLDLIRNEELNEAVVRACREGASARLELQPGGSAPAHPGHARLAAGARAAGCSAAVFHDVTDLRRLEKVRKDFVANV